MAMTSVKPVHAPANENSSLINLASIRSLFRALPDADQIRLLSALYDEISFDADTMHDALRDMACEVSGFRVSDNYVDLLRADDIYPCAIHSKAARDLYRADRDRRLTSIVAHVARRVGA